jgi:hypothetical protein
MREVFFTHEIIGLDHTLHVALRIKQARNEDKSKKLGGVRHLVDTNGDTHKKMLQVIQMREDIPDFCRGVRPAGARR